MVFFYLFLKNSTYVNNNTCKRPFIGQNSKFLQEINMKQLQLCYEIVTKIPCKCIMKIQKYRKVSYCTTKMTYFCNLIHHNLGFLD